MKPLSILLIFVITLILISGIMLFYSPEFAFGIPFLCLALGFISRRQQTRPLIKTIGTVIFYISIFALLMLTAIFLWLSYNWPK